VDDIRIGLICRALRRRLGWRQRDLAERAGVHQTTISRLERGQFATLSIETVRRIFVALGARYNGMVTWRGGEIDRLLDAEHAALAETIAETYRGRGWQVVPEVSFSRYGERGSIDLLSLLPAQRAVVINEIKSDVHSVEETHRRHDVKVRLPPAIVMERFGWKPLVVARVLVVPESMSVRRTIERHQAVFDAAYPSRARELLAWLRNPARPISGIWFLSRKPRGVVRSVRSGRSRVRRRPSLMEGGRRRADDNQNPI